MIDAYVTAVESQVHLAEYADWLALTDAQQDTHLSWGRVYIDSKYRCPYDETDSTEDLKHANSLLGYLNFLDLLYADKGPSVDSVSVAAGSVSSAKTYSGGYRASTPMMTQAQALLVGDCTGNNNTIPLTRT